MRPPMQTRPGTSDLGNGRAWRRGAENRGGARGPRKSRLFTRARRCRAKPVRQSRRSIRGIRSSVQPRVNPAYLRGLAPMSGGDWCSADIRAEARNKLGGSPTRRSCSQPAPGCSAPRSKPNPRPPLQAACACCPPWGFAKSPYPGVDRTLRNPDRESRRSDTIGALPDPARVAASGPDDREPGSILMASTWPCRTPYRVCIEAHAQ
jgi:hypothetical protein